MWPCEELRRLAASDIPAPYPAQDNRNWLFVNRSIRFFFITDQPDMARYVAANGVDRIFVDLETLGKHERQGHLSTVISDHSIEGLAAICQLNLDVEVMARLNPVNAETALEVEAAISAGAEILMLPMFRTVEEVERFSHCVAGRARICLLVETQDAARNLAACIAVPGVDEVHIGLNDLSLDLGLPFMFQPLAQGLIDPMAATLRNAGLPFGIGGVARADEGLLPAQYLLGEHARLGSTAAILSRTFHRMARDVPAIEREMDFAAEVGKLRAAFDHFRTSSADTLERNRLSVVDKTNAVVNALAKAQA
jgi:2-keto-3-deoxy-L-rhamnonate aldolase RhmA